MQTTATISTGVFNLGEVSVDSSQVRGEGGILAPAIVIPVTVELDQRSRDEELALTRLDVELWLRRQSGRAQLGASVSVFGDGSIWRTTDRYAFQTSVDLRFPITFEMVRLIEETVHTISKQRFNLHLTIHPALALVANSKEVPTQQGMQGQANILGTAVELLPIASSIVDKLEISLDRGHWAEVAKGLGLGEMRTVGIRLPKKVEGLEPGLVSRFDAAVDKYETRDYRGAIGICRDLRTMVEESLNATRANPVSEVLAADRGLSLTSPPIRFVDDAWKLLAKATNDAHHEQSIGVYTSTDARAMLLFTAILLEHLADSLRRRL